jgi:hypothetical protein
VILKSARVGPLTRILRGLADGLEVPAAGGLRLAIDRDPVSLL